MHAYVYVCLHIIIYIQGDSLPDQQSLRGDSRHEDKYYLTGNHGAQTCSVGAKEH